MVQQYCFSNYPKICQVCTNNGSPERFRILEKITYAILPLKPNYGPNFLTTIENTAENRIMSYKPCPFAMILTL